MHLRFDRPGESQEAMDGKNNSEHAYGRASKIPPELVMFEYDATTLDQWQAKRG